MSKRLQKIEDFFPKGNPNSFKITDSYGDAISETKPFQGLFWMDVRPILFKENFEVFCFFSPQAFCYYMPALVKCSLEDFNSCELATDSVIGLLNPQTSFSAEIAAWRRDRWSHLTKEQFEVIVEWLEYYVVEEYDPFEIEERVIPACDAIKNGVWKDNK